MVEAPQDFFWIDAPISEPPSPQWLVVDFQATRDHANDFKPMNSAIKNFFRIQVHRRGGGSLDDAIAHMFPLHRFSKVKCSIKGK